MNKKMQKTADFLNELYPNAKCALNYSSPYQLLVAVVLSAQCTDKRVNIVTEDLFKIAPNAEKMVELGIDDIAKIIKPCGLYNAKSKSIYELSKDIIDKFGGEVPCNREGLMTLRGVGRKTANVVLANCFGADEIAVDTHIQRIAKRLGFAKDNYTPLETELEIRKLTDEGMRANLHHQLIFFGRNICKAINPKCEECKLKEFCRFYVKK